MTEGENGEAIDWTPASGRDGIRIGRLGEDLVVEWRGVGHLRRPASAGDGEFFVADGADPVRLEKFMATSLMACRRYLNGSVSLHGSAVSLPFGCVALLGKSGAGKSTAAMALVENFGGGFVADDIIPVDWRESTAFVPPVDDSFWLARDARRWFGLRDGRSTDKDAHSPRLRSTHPQPLCAAVDLVFDDGAEVSFERVRGHDAFMVLSAAHVCYPTGEDGEAIRNFSKRAQLAGSVPVFRLCRPRAFRRLGAAMELLVRRLSEAAA